MSSASPTTDVLPQGLRVYRDDDGTIEEVSFCPSAQKIQALASTFHSLQEVSGINPWDVELLATDSFHLVSSGARASIHFALSVWSPGTPESFDLGPFDMHQALKIWDQQNRSAFATWARDPWWL